MKAVLIGSALPPDVVSAHSRASAAAARWQMEFAGAIAAELQLDVDCLSLLPVSAGEDGLDSATPIQVTDKVRVLPITWKRRVGGTFAYCMQMLWQIFTRRSRTKMVFCYNSTFWTAPWAILLSVFSGAPLIMIVADLAPVSGGLAARIVGRLERVLLRGAHRFLLLSPASAELLPHGARTEIFVGLADSTALSYPLPHHSAKVRFVFAGALNEFGGIRTFLKAAAEIAADSPSCEFHIFGRGKLSEPIPESILSRTVIHGFVPEAELDVFLGDSCVGVNPRPDPQGLSRYNAPYKLLHYVSRGVATITTVTPGVTPQIAAACVVAGDGVSGLVEAMREVLSLTPDQRQALGHGAREAAILNLSQMALATRIRRLLEDSSLRLETQ